MDITSGKASLVEILLHELNHATAEKTKFEKTANAEAQALKANNEKFASLSSQNQEKLTQIRANSLSEENSLTKTSVMFDTLAYASGVEFTAVGYTAKDTTSSLLSNNADYSNVAGNGETFLPLLYFAGAVAFDMLVDYAIDKSGSETARKVKDGIDLAMTLTPLGAAKNGGKELVKVAAKEGAEFVSENVAKVTAKTTAKEVAKTTGETLTENIAKTATKEAAGETAETTAKTATKESTEALGEKLAKESVKDATEVVSQNIAKTTAKESTEALGEKLAKDATKDGAESVVKTTTKKPSDDVAETAEKTATDSNIGQKLAKKEEVADKTSDIADVATTNFDNIKPGDKFPNWNGPVDYSDIINPKNIGIGKKTTPNQKKLIYKKNRDANDGFIVSDRDGSVCCAPLKSEKGVTPILANMWQMKSKCWVK